MAIKDLYNPISNPSGSLSGMNVKLPSSLSSIYKGTPTDPLARLDLTRVGITPMMGITNQNVLPESMRRGPAPQLSMAAPAPAPAPVAPPVTPPGPGGYVPPPVGGAPGVPGATGPTAAPAPAAAPIDPRWLKADGTIKTPDEIAHDVGTTLAAAHGTGDVGTLAAEQFRGGDKSAVELEAEARRIGNTRNDIAVGETDPYGVGADSGIAYTAAELAAIEKAYAGVYDPALDTALAKVTEKKEKDAAEAERKASLEEIRLQAQLDADKPYTLGKDEVRYDALGNPIAVGIPGDSGTGPGTYVPGADPTVDAFVKGVRDGTYKASDVPDEYKALVAQGMAATRPAISQSSTEAVSVINQLLEKNLEDISGFRITDPSSLFPGTAVQGTMNLAKQLKGMLSLDNRQQLKGSGAISDFEFRVLGEASSALGIDDNGRTNLSPEQFKAELEKMQLKLLVGETELTDDELLHLRDSGYTVEQIRDYSNRQAFSTVGNTTASTGSGNRPQRNNNPGNVKVGGLADNLAVGHDDQNHLIFPDAATGFRALAADLTAKLNGGSSHVPADPTIAQLGKAWAEDSNWPAKVAAYAGVSPSTPAKSVPFSSLVQAIARQEGFYA